MFIAVLFIIAKLYKQPRCPTTDELRKCGTYTKWNFYSATKKNEILTFAGKWIELENIILSKISQAQKSKNCCSPSYAGYRPKTNAVILLNMDHTLRGECPWEKLGKGRKPKLKYD
jgi:hypothetical protein